ncbi:hypothetical protein [Streptomyces beigongshangae]|uniref:hypothetical protein n=1 Tax=Streptomyces beigongshangae TaxID=2841597 RepID=UPI001C841BD5|nr:hypothetical protein [Streptomyces sp. REN17]
MSAGGKTRATRQFGVTDVRIGRIIREDDQRPTAKQTTEGNKTVRKVPHDQPGSLAMLLDAKVGSDDLFFDLLRFLSMKGLERDPARLGGLAQSFTEQVRTQTG